MNKSFFYFIILLQTDPAPDTEDIVGTTRITNTQTL